MVRRAGQKIALNDEDKELQKQRILKAAVEVFGRHGYEKTTVSQIAQEADMGRGTLYWYFKSKEDLFRNIIRVVIADLTVPIQGILDQETNLEEKLRYLIRSWLQVGVRQQGFFRIFHSVFAQSQGEFAQEMLRAMRSMYLLLIDTLETMYSQAGIKGQIKKSDSHRLARLTIGVVDGIILQHMLVEPVNPELMTEVIIQLMLKGLENGNVKDAEIGGGKEGVQ